MPMMGVDELSNAQKHEKPTWTAWVRILQQDSNELCAETLTWFKHCWNSMSLREHSFILELSIWDEIWSSIIIIKTEVNLKETIIIPLQ